MAKYVKTKITSDGTVGGTHVYNAETGVEIPGVVGLRFEHGAGQPPFAYITLLTFVEEALLVSDGQINGATVQ